MNVFACCDQLQKLIRLRQSSTWQDVEQLKCGPRQVRQRGCPLVAMHPPLGQLATIGRRWRFGGRRVS